MLVLSRKQGEKITVGTSDGPIVIMVTRIQSNGKVRLGIEAPNGCEILRNEILLKPDGTPEVRDDSATDGHVSTIAEGVPARS